MLVTSIFSFSQNVLKSLLSQGRLKAGLCGIELMHLTFYQMTSFLTVQNKAFADEKIKVTEKLKFVCGRAENSVGKGENTDDKHFFLFPHCFQKFSFSGS